MIFGIVGKPGGGKSYEAVRYHILPAVIEDKRKVVTNIPVNKEHIEKIYGKEYADLIEVVEGNFHDFGNERAFSSEKHFLQYEEWRNEKGQGVLFVVDEAHLCLGLRAPLPVTEFLSMHRHYGFDIALLTQNQRKLHRDIRDMVDVVFHCAKMEIYGEAGYVRKIFHGFSNMRDPVKVEERKYDVEYFEYYKSHTKSDSSIKEAQVKDSGANRNPYSKVTKIFFGISAAIFCFLIYRVFIEDDSGKKINEAQEKIKTLPENKAPEVDPVTGQRQKLEKEIQAELEKRERVAEKKRTINEEIESERIAKSKQYHPFSNVQLHFEGHYEDMALGQSNVYFSASTNGQKIFTLTLKDFAMAGYKVSIIGDCVAEITYFEYREFVICDAPTLSTGLTEVASSAP